MNIQSLVSDVDVRARAVAKAFGDAVHQTPLTYSSTISQMTGCRVFLKQENLQVTGSCKARSAMTNLMRLTDAQRRLGVVTASTGNNGIATAWAAGRLGIEKTVYLPHNTVQYKVDAIRAGGGRIVFHGNDIVEAELAARTFAASTGATYVSPYNGMGAIDGQATIGAEIADQLDALGESLDAILVPVGGGGLISGIGSYLRAVGSKARIVGAQPAESPVMARSIAAGHILDMPSPPTLSDATAGGLEPNTITFEVCRAIVDEFVLVDEDAIARSMMLAYDSHDIVLEGAGALSIAALFERKEAFAGQTVVLFLCGSNIDRDDFAQLRMDATA